MTDLGALSGSRGPSQASCLGPSGFDPERKTFPWTFKFYGERRQAYQEACAHLRAYGFSIGSRQRGSPTGIMYGDYLISKWRSMSEVEREELHGRIFADREPVSVYFPALPPEIDDAVFAMHAAQGIEARQRHDRESGHGRDDESPVANGDAPND